MRIALLPLLLAFALPAPAAEAPAPPATPQDFAHGFALQVPEGVAVCRVRLPPAVYGTLQRTDLSDLAVFDGAGTLVPQALEGARAAPAAAGGERALPFYAIAPAQRADIAGALHLRLDTAGTVLSIDAPAGAAPPAAGTGTWILDAGEQAPRITALRLDWEAPGEGFVQRVTVQGSADLGSWRTLGAGTVADLQQGGHRLRQDTVALSGDTARFLRLEFGPGPRPALRAASALVPPPGAVPEREVLVLEGTPAATPGEGWLFDAGGPLPVEQLRLRLAQENDLAEFELWSRAAEADAWQPRGRVLAWRVRQGELQLEGGELSITPLRHRHWRVRALGEDRAAPAGTPRLEIAWQAESLLFLARGRGPYTLAAGSATRSVAPQPIATLLAAVGGNTDPQVGEATLGEPRRLGGEAALQPPPEPVPWQRYLMWATLLAAVAVLLRMALALLRG